MINHVRTLLLNENGATRPAPDFFMEEYVDPKYGALTLPAYLTQARAPLFGAGADIAYKNYVMRLLMTLLHSTEFASYVYALDTRVTYLNRPSVAGTSIETSATPTNDLALAGAAEVTGVPSSTPQRVQWDWDVEVVSGGPTVFQVQVSRRQPYARQLFTVNFADGHSDLVPLPGQSQLFFRFLASMTVGASWAASAFILPTVDVAAIMQTCENGVDTGQLFGNAEPFKTFGELWRKHVYLTYKMSGYLLAVAYRMEEVRANATR
jgi:hypothetical protein